MDKKLQKYYEDRFEMMSTQGWLDLVEDIEGMIQATNDISGIEDDKTLFKRKGELSIMKWMVGLKRISEEVYEELKNESSL